MISAEGILIALFLAITTFFVYKYRARLTIIKPPVVFPFLYAALYKSRRGINEMDRVARRFPRLLRYAGYLGILVGFLGMAVVTFSVIQSFLNLFLRPEQAAGVAPVLPLKAKGVFFILFFYWIISIFILAVVHEFSHGVIARLYRIPLKATGFGFLGIIFPAIPFAFVEPHETAMARRNLRQQFSMLAAGAFSNIVVGFLFFGLFLLTAPLASNAFLEFNGVGITGFVNETSPLKVAGASVGEVIIGVNDAPIYHYDNFTKFLEKTQPGQKVKIKTNASEYLVVLASNPDKPDRGYLGVLAEPNAEVKENAKKLLGGALAPMVFWLLGLLATLYLLNIGIGLFNLIPILTPIQADGGRMLRLAAERFLGKKTGEQLWKFVSLIILAMVLVLLAAAFLK